ncbi:actin nucleation-promoting factor WASL-like [Halichondria panicea]|uniref:actin nucleation-promoting factor WASL-like n=1 Tax=Halichondria panicea TaxID=6063 RepID=UPI00312B6F13
MSASKAEDTIRQDIISKLCNSDEGLVVLFKTIATVYQHNPKQNNDETDGQTPDADWTVVGYGIPTVLATKSKVTLCISDFDENLPGHEITISSTTQLVQTSEYFTVIGIHNGTYFGLSFSDEAIAGKITSLISLVVPNLLTPKPDEGSIPKRIKLSQSSIEGESDPNGDNEWVMIEQEDAKTDAGGTEDVDSPGIFRRNTLRRKSGSRSNSPLTISEPSNFRHISHVGDDTSVVQLSKSMTASVGQDSVGMSSEPRPPPTHRESGTESTFSFGEVLEPGPDSSAVPPPPPIAPPPPPPPPPPSAMDTLKKMGAQPLPGMSLQDELLKGVALKSSAAPGSSSGNASSIAEELKRGIFLRPVGSSSKTLPKPPSTKNKGQLLFEINTFRRNTLRHVETKNMTDFQADDPDSLQSVLRCSLEKMRSRLNMRNFSKVADVNRDGEESGFEDDYDGALIV